MGRKRKAPGSAENERLEWLGDALLECAVSQLVVRALCQRRECSRVHLYACVREALLSNEALARVFLALRLDRAGGSTGEVKARADVVEALAAHLFLELRERQDSAFRLDALLEAICDGGARVAAQSYRGSVKRSDASCHFTPIGRVGNNFGVLENVQDVESGSDASDSDESVCVADILREKTWEEAERAKQPAQRAADDRSFLRAPPIAAAPTADSATAPERVQTHAQRDAAVASALNEPTPTVDVLSVIRRLRELWGFEWSPPATPRGVLCTSSGSEYLGPDASTLRRLGLASVAAGLSIALFMDSDNETQTPGDLTVTRQQLLSGLAGVANEELGADMDAQLARETLLVAIGLMCSLSTTLSVDHDAPRDTRATPATLCGRTVARLLAGASQSCRQRPGLHIPFARLPKAQQAMARLLSPMLNKTAPVHQTEEPKLLHALERDSLSLRPTIPPPKRKKNSRKKRSTSSGAQEEGAECEISATLRRLRALNRNAQRTLERLAPTELLCQLEQRLLDFLAQSTNSSLRLPAQDNFERLLVHLLCRCHALESRSHDSNPGSGLRAVEVSASSRQAGGRRQPAAFSVCRFLVETTTGHAAGALPQPGLDAGSRT